MWSHYADQYAGAVVEFDGPYEFFDGQIDVEYTPDARCRRIRLTAILAIRNFVLKPRASGQLEAKPPVDVVASPAGVLG